MIYSLIIDDVADARHVPRTVVDEKVIMVEATSKKQLMMSDAQAASLSHFPAAMG